MESHDGRADEPDEDGMNSAVSTLDTDLLADDVRAAPASMNAFLKDFTRLSRTSKQK